MVDGDGDGGDQRSPRETLEVALIVEIRDGTHLPRVAIELEGGEDGGGEGLSRDGGGDDTESAAGDAGCGCREGGEARERRRRRGERERRRAGR